MILIHKLIYQTCALPQTPFYINESFKFKCSLLQRTLFPSVWTHHYFDHILDLFHMKSHLFSAFWIRQFNFSSFVQGHLWLLFGFLFREITAFQSKAKELRTSWLHGRRNCKLLHFHALHKETEWHFFLLKQTICALVKKCKKIWAVVTSTPGSLAVRLLRHKIEKEYMKWKFLKENMFFFILISSLRVCYSQSPDWPGNIKAERAGNS